VYLFASRKDAQGTFGEDKRNPNQKIDSGLDDIVIVM
jgi:hypothetical protein